MIGKTISHYKVIEKLGEGGMGVVYKAQDTKLKRSVALKFLPPELTRDKDAKERFTHEAQAASALDHTNICTIYEINETEDQQLFIVMACYEGEILKDKIERGPLKLEEAVDIAIQIAKGLEKAHKKEIVHRDIKPGNIFITHDGVVKIVDFGLAKLKGQVKLTKEGTTLGTAAYMSPENARSSEVDHRTDIWSLGIVLYEMLTGKLPFRGEYEQAVIYSILNEDPEPVTALRTGIPMDLERIINKCLAKEPERRYQVIADVIVDLKEITRNMGDVKSITLRYLKSQKTPTLPLFRQPRIKISLFAIIVLGILCLLIIWLNTGKTKLPTVANAQRITSAIGYEDFPSWRPDATELVYEADPRGLRGEYCDILITTIDGAATENLTGEYPILRAERCPNWSPSGNLIAYRANDPEEGWGVYTRPAREGEESKVGSIITASRLNQPCWSPDDSELAFQTYDDSVDIVNLLSRSSRRLHLPGPEGFITFLHWSPDGNYLAYVVTQQAWIEASQIWIFSLQDSNAFSITESWCRNWSPVWSPDMQYLFYISNHDGNMDLWVQPLDSESSPKGDPSRLTFGWEMQSIALSADGNKLAYSQGRAIGNIYRVPFLKNRPATWVDAEQLTKENAFIQWIDLSPDGKTLVFDSDRSGNMDIYTMPSEGGTPRPIISNPSPDMYPAWHPEGDNISFCTYREENWDIYVAPIKMGELKRLTYEKTWDGDHSWSPDGQNIAVQSNRDGEFRIWTMHIKSGEYQSFVDYLYGQGPRYSPNGESLLFTSRPLRLMLMSASGGKPTQVTDIQQLYSSWWPDGTKIIMTAYHDNNWNIWEVLPDGRDARPLTDLRGELGAISRAPVTDGQYVYFSWVKLTGDIMVMDVLWD